MVRCGANLSGSLGIDDNHIGVGALRDMPLLREDVVDLGRCSGGDLYIFCEWQLSLRHHLVVGNDHALFDAIYTIWDLTEVFNTLAYVRQIHEMGCSGSASFKRGNIAGKRSVQASVTPYLFLLRRVEDCMVSPHELYITVQNTLLQSHTVLCILADRWRHYVLRSDLAGAEANVTKACTQSLSSYKCMRWCCEECSHLKVGMLCHRLIQCQSGNDSLSNDAFHL